MTITIDLHPEIERGLSVQAQARGVSLEHYVQQIVMREAHAAVSAAAVRPMAEDLFDLFSPVRGVLTDDEIARFFSRNPSRSRPVDFG